MAYTKQNFKSGQTLKAEHLNNIENGIENIETEKQDKLVSGTNIKTINGTSLLGAGDITISGDGTTTTQNSIFEGKTIAVLGDSISTQFDLNAVEMKIEKDDVGVELSAYLTYYDFDAGLSLGDHTFTSDEVGNEVVFTPTQYDVGKKIGLPKNYNTSLSKTWWQVVAESLGCNITPVCWSGSSISAHEENDSAAYKTAHAWHEAQIRKLGTRVAGSMTRVAPDLVIIYRGCNDMTHEPYALLTENYFNDPNWAYPTTDAVDGGNGYKEALSLTIKRIREVYPNTQIVLCTNNVFKRVDYDNFPTTNGLYSLPQMNKAIREVADFFGCQTIDFDKAGITFENCYSEGYITDSANIPTHPNANGHAVMGQQAIKDLTNKISQLLNDGSEYTPSIPEQEEEEEEGGDTTLTQLSAPTVTVSETGLASWTEVENASSYSYSIDGGTAVNTSELSFQLTNGQSIRVKAIGDGVSYSDSEYSEIQAYYGTLGDISDWTYTIDGNSVMLNSYVGENTDVTVYGNYEVDGEVYSAVIPSVTTETVAEAVHPFANNTDITSVTFEDGVSLYNNSAECLFYGCTGLKTITNIPYISGDAQSMCYGCSSLEAYPTFANFNATSLLSAFEGCTNMVVENLELPESVTNFQKAFKNCKNIISVGSMTNAKANAGQGIFHGCTNLVSVGDLYYTGTLGYDLFNNCTSLKSVGKILGTKLTKPLRMFSGCSALEGEVYFESPNITAFDSTFAGVDLTKVTIKVPADSTTYTNLIAAYPSAVVETY